MAENEAWLNLTLEDAIETDLIICDSHHHLWYHTDHDYSLEDFIEDTAGGHHIASSVYVECWLMLKEHWPSDMLPSSETELIQGAARQNAGGKTDAAAGIVGFADLTLGAAVAPVLESHLSASRERFRGIRHTTHWDPSPEIWMPWETPRGLMAYPNFREGFDQLYKYSLSFDACIFHTQLMELADLARAFPETVIILNHMGNPLSVGPYAERRAEVFSDWRCGMAALAAFPNVFVKVGGMGTGVYGFGWHEQATPPGSAELAEAMKPYFDVCVKQFGVNRCMFESNFPVDKKSYSYTVIWNAFKRLTRDISHSERRSTESDRLAGMLESPLLQAPSRRDRRPCRERPPLHDRHRCAPRNS